ncbi:MULTISPECIES: transposase [unclassified Wolbachia]|uniref:transposase n=1 Tax=unclassified Wolbachia TaxID=2640676 RepID=UPI0022329904|nr:transposase [Wolbachia endosymbiont (group A) of Apoderus coryli]
MRKKYPTDLSEREWSLIEKHFRVSYKKGGRPLKHSKREVLSAIFMYYVQDVNGAIYRTPWKKVYEQFRRWKKQGIFEKMNYDITKYSRSKMGRNEEPSACIVICKNDRKRGVKGYDGGKKVKGRKRYIISGFYIRLLCGCC